MNLEAFDADTTLPPAALPAGLSLATFAGAPALTRGNEPTEVVILIEAEQYSGA